MPNVWSSVGDWLGQAWWAPAGRLIWACIALVVMMIPVIILVRRPKPDEPSTWAASMIGAVYVFALFLIVYAIIPHEVLTFTSNYLQWDTTHYLVKSTSEVPGVSAWNWPVSVNAQAIRDIVVSTLYLVFIAGNLYLFSAWQKRPTESEAAEAQPVEVGKSRFGRPLRAKA